MRLRIYRRSELNPGRTARNTWGYLVVSNVGGGTARRLDVKPRGDTRAPIDPDAFPLDRRAAGDEHEIPLGQVPTSPLGITVAATWRDDEGEQSAIMQVPETF